MSEYVLVNSEAYLKQGSREHLIDETAYGRKFSRAKERDLKLMTNAHRHTDWVHKNPTYRPYLDGLSSFCVQG